MRNHRLSREVNIPGENVEKKKKKKKIRRRLHVKARYGLFEDRNEDGEKKSWANRTKNKRINVTSETITGHQWGQKGKSNVGFLGQAKRDQSKESRLNQSLRTVYWGPAALRKRRQSISKIKNKKDKGKINYKTTSSSSK